MVTDYQKRMIETDAKVDMIMDLMSESFVVKSEVFDRYPLHAFQLFYTFDDGSMAYTVVRADKSANASYMAQDNILVDYDTGEAFTKDDRGDRGSVCGFTQFRMDKPII